MVRRGGRVIPLVRPALADGEQPYVARLRLTGAELDPEDLILVDSDHQGGTFSGSTAWLHRWLILPTSMAISCSSIRAAILSSACCRAQTHGTTRCWLRNAAISCVSCVRSLQRKLTWIGLICLSRPAYSLRRICSSAYRAASQLCSKSNCCQCSRGCSAHERTSVFIF